MEWGMQYIVFQIQERRFSRLTKGLKEVYSISGADFQSKRKALAKEKISNSIL